MFLDKLILRGFVRHLTALTVGLAGCPAGASSLADLPDNVVEQILDQETETEWTSTDRRIALTLAARDPRTLIRLRAAQNAASGGYTLTEVEPLLMELACDLDSKVRASAADGLADLLAGSSPLERTAVIGDWVTSSSPFVRLAIARALARPIDALHLTLAFEQLALDPVLEVRRAAAIAAHERGADEPELLSAFLARQLMDLDPDGFDS